VCPRWDAAPCVEVGCVSLCASTLGDVDTSFKTELRSVVWSCWRHLRRCSTMFGLSEDGSMVVKRDGDGQWCNAPWLFGDVHVCRGRFFKLR
jgi:hypothetical protein